MKDLFVEFEMLSKLSANEIRVLMSDLILRYPHLLTGASAGLAEGAATLLKLRDEYVSEYALTMQVYDHNKSSPVFRARFLRAMIHSGIASGAPVGMEYIKEYGILLQNPEVSDYLDNMDFHNEQRF